MPGYRSWSNGDNLTPADIDGYLMGQTTMRFATTAARDAALPTPAAGMQCYVTATGLYYFYAGGAWQTKFFNLAPATANYMTTVTATDVAGCSLTVPIYSTGQRFLVSATFDVTVLTTGGGTFIGQLSVDGTLQSGQALAAMPATVNVRQTIGQQWLVTGLPSGSRVIKLQASSTVAGVYRTSTTHTSVAVTEF